LKALPFRARFNYVLIDPQNVKDALGGGGKSIQVGVDDLETLLQVNRDYKIISFEDRGVVPICKTLAHKFRSVAENRIEIDPQKAF
jgi:hypothetical protein